MNKLLTIALKFLLLVFLVVTLGFAGYWLHVRFGWTYLQLGGAFGAVFAVSLGIYSVRRVYYRRREERFVRSMVSYDVAALTLHEERERIAELRDRWAKGVQTLRSSKLRFSGNPIYSLPWFLVFGESGAGKSTAISHARLSASASEAGPLAHVPNTRNCDWWFFEQAVILDTAGRYAVPINPEADNKEWEEFLLLLAGQRKREPLNGVVLALPATRLLEDEPGTVLDYGRSIRQRIETLNRHLNAQIPIYILVTKMDQVMGMTEFGSLLDEEEQQQALGLLNDDTTAPPVDFLAKAFTHVYERLRDFSLLLSARLSHPDTRPGTAPDTHPNARETIFPREFLQLKPGVEAFVQGVFAPSPYSETPMLRGLFFSSGRQNGEVTAGSLQKCATLAGKTWKLPGTDAPLFLHNFFTAILPRERGIVNFFDSILSRITLTRNLGFMAWLAFLFSLNVYFGVSFMANMSTLESAGEELVQMPTAHDSLHGNVLLLNRVADTISDLEEAVGRKWWQYPGRRQVRTVADMLRQRYVGIVRPKVFLENAEVFARALQDLPPDEQRFALAMYCEYLSWTIDVMEAVRDGKPIPPPIEDITTEYKNQAGMVLPLSNQFLNRVFVSYARWEDPKTLSILVSQARQSVRHYMDQLDENLDWITDWLNSRTLLEPVPLSFYWGGTNDTLAIPRVYTARGRERMEQMLTSLEKASTARSLFQERADNYRFRYAQEFRSAWWRMAENFHLGPSLLTTPQQWESHSANMALLENAYFRFVEDMGEEFAAVSDMGKTEPIDALPGLFIEVMEAHKQKRQEQTLKTKLEQAAATGQRALRTGKEAEQFQVNIDTAENHLSGYLAQLEKIRLNCRTDAESMALASAGYLGESNLVEEAIPLATLLEASIDPDADKNGRFWNLIKGPLAFQTTLAIHRSACVLNNFWKSDVVFYADNSLPEDRWHALFSGTNPPVANFLEGVAMPFLERSRSGWVPATWLGIPYPVNADFLAFLGYENVQETLPEEEYRVRLTTRPTNVNTTADKPYRVRLILQCGDTVQELDNYNYPQNKTFIWGPGICDDTRLEIYFTDGKIQKRWPGEWGFKEFLSAFRGDTLRLTNEDFPDQRELLNSMDVTYIDVNYSINGASPIRKLSPLPSLKKIPQEAAMCLTRISTKHGKSNVLQPVVLPAVQRASPEEGGKSNGGGR